MARPRVPHSRAVLRLVCRMMGILVTAGTFACLIHIAVAWGAHKSVVERPLATGLTGTSIGLLFDGWEMFALLDTPAGVGRAWPPALLAVDLLGAGFGLAAVVFVLFSPLFSSLEEYGEFRARDGVQMATLVLLVVFVVFRFLFFGLTISEWITARGEKKKAEYKSYARQLDRFTRRSE